jgi:hypothetical protein
MRTDADFSPFFGESDAAADVRPGSTCPARVNGIGTTRALDHSEGQTWARPVRAGVEMSAHEHIREAKHSVIHSHTGGPSCHRTSAFGSRPFQFTAGGCLRSA